MLGTRRRRRGAIDGGRCPPAPRLQAGAHAQVTGPPVTEVAAPRRSLQADGGPPTRRRRCRRWWTWPPADRGRVQPRPSTADVGPAVRPWRRRGERRGARLARFAPRARRRCRGRPDGAPGAGCAAPGAHAYALGQAARRREWRRPTPMTVPRALRWATAHRTKVTAPAATTPSPTAPEPHAAPDNVQPIRWSRE